MANDSIPGCGWRRRVSRGAWLGALVSIAAHAGELSVTNVAVGAKGLVMAQAQTDHYVVWAKDRPMVVYAAQAAEELRQDFLQTFQGGLKLSEPADRLPLVCLEPSADASGRGPLLVPGIYNSYSGVAAILMAGGAGALDQNNARLRHEAAHQLVDAMFSIPTVRNDRTFWYHEGLACYFEGTGKYRLSGRVVLMRLGTLEVAYGSHAIPDLKEVVDFDPESGAPPMEPFRYYALAWSLAHFLIHGDNGSRRDRFFAYLQNLREWNRKGRSGELFTRAFPDSDALQEAWVRHIYLLQRGTPDQVQAALKPVGDKPGAARTKEEESLLPTLPPPVPAPALEKPVTKEAMAEVLEIVNGDRGLAAAQRQESIRKKLAAQELAVPALAQATKSADANTRLLAIQALGDLRARVAMDILVERALTDASPEARLAAARAIGKMNYGIAPQALYTPIYNGIPAKAIPAIEALKEIKDPYSTDLLLAALHRLVKGGGISLSVSDRPAPTAKGKTRAAGPAPMFGSGPQGSIGYSSGKGGAQRTPVVAALVDALRTLAPRDLGDRPEDWLAWDRQRRAAGR